MPAVHCPDCGEDTRREWQDEGGSLLYCTDTSCPYSVVAIGSPTTATANRAAAELVDRYGVPSVYDDAVTLAALGYLKGAMDQIVWARNIIRGDAA